MHKLVAAAFVALTASFNASAWTALTLPEAHPKLGIVKMWLSSANPTSMRGLSLTCLGTQGAWLKFEGNNNEGWQAPALNDYPAIEELIVETMDGQSVFTTPMLDFWGESGKVNLDNVIHALNNAVTVRVVSDDNREFRMYVKGNDKIAANQCKAGFPPMVDEKSRTVKTDF